MPIFRRTRRVDTVPSNAFGVVQPDVGTSPTADAVSDVLTVTSSDDTITVTGDSGTDTLTLNVDATHECIVLAAQVFR